MAKADLGVKFGNIIETPTIFPQEQGRVEVEITNQGDATFQGPLNLKLYASTDDVLDLKPLNILEKSLDDRDILQGTDELLGNLRKQNFTLAPGKSQTFTVDFADSNFRTASVVSPGLYYLFADVKTGKNSNETNKSNNRDSQLITQGDTVIQWNSILLNAIQASGKDGGEGTAPPLAARNAAIVHTAIYDAVSAIENDKPFKVDLDPPQGASTEAAVVGAAYQTLTTLFPEQQATFYKQRQRSLSEIKDSNSAKNGFDFGVKVADKILDLRENDGAKTADVPFTPGKGIGDWQYAYKDGETTDGIEGVEEKALLPDWGTVDPFVIESGSQFRPDSFPQYNSPRYARELNQVKSKGAENSTTRSADQTENALFWAYDRADTFRPPGQWNEIAQDVALAKGNTLEENARLFGILNVGMADAGIAAWDAKYSYEQIRPITAIRGADQDNNPDTIADPTWEPLLDTPPFPDYISGHATFGGAASAILGRFFGDDTSFDIPSQELPGISRSYGSFTQAAEENADSRFYGGVHINAANVDGVAVGQEIGNFVFDALV